MFDSKKIAATAGVLGSFALIGVGAAQAFGQAGPGSGKCVEDRHGNVTCVQKGRYTFTSDGHKVSLTNNATQTCGSSKGKSVTCRNDVSLGG